MSTNNPKTRYIVIDGEDQMVFDQDNYSKIEGALFTDVPNAEVRTMDEVSLDDEIDDNSLYIVSTPDDQKQFIGSEYRKIVSGLRDLQAGGLSVNKVSFYDSKANREYNQMRGDIEVVDSLKATAGERRQTRADFINKAMSNYIATGEVPEGVSEDVSKQFRRVFRRAGQGNFVYRDVMKKLDNLYVNVDPELEEAQARLDANPLYQQMLAEDKANREKALADLKTEVDRRKEETYPRNTGGSSSSVVYMPSMMGGTYVPPPSEKEMQQAKKHSLNVLASDLIEDTYEWYNKPSKKDGFKMKNFFEGAGEALSDPSFWSMGLYGIAENMGLQGALKDIQNALGSLDTNDALKRLTDKDVDKLTPEEAEKLLLTKITPDQLNLIKAFAMNAQAQVLRADDIPWEYKAGQGAVESLGFMAQFILTGGVAGAVGGGIKKLMMKVITKGLRQNAGKFAKGVSKVAMSKVGKAVMKPVIGGVSSAAAAGIRTPLMGSTWENVAERMNMIGDDGRLKNTGKDFWLAMADSYIESLAEEFAPLQAAMGGLGRLTGKGLSKMFMSESLPNVFKGWSNTPFWSFAKQGGWGGMFTEMVEEFFGAGIRTATGLDPNAWRETTSAEGLLTMAASFAPMTLIGGIISTGQYAWAKHNAKNTANHLRGVLAEHGYTEDQANYLLDYTRHKSLSGLTNTLSPVMSRLMVNEATPQGRGKVAQAFMEYAQAVSRYQAMDGVYQTQESQQREQMSAAIQESLGGAQFWMEGELHGAKGTEYEGQVSIGRYVETFYNEATGMGGYVVGRPTLNARGEREAAVLYEDGTKGFENVDQVPTARMSVDDYLSQRIMEKRQMDEAGRIDGEVEAQLVNVKKSVQMGMSINLGTQEQPAMGIVQQITDDGVILKTEDGQFVKKDWRDIASALGTPIVAQTDAEIEAQEVSLLDAEEEAKRARRSAEIGNVEEAEEEGAVAAEEVAISQEKPLPYKADGSVDQTALWNADPARWAQWNDERRQDGGMDSQKYVVSAISRIDGEIARLEKKRENAPDFDQRDIIEGQIRLKQERRNVLQSIIRSYAQGAVDAGVAAQSQQGNPAVQKALTPEEQHIQDMDDAVVKVLGLYEEGKLTVDEVRDNIAARIKKANSALEKHRKKQPKMGEDPAAYLRSKEEYRAKEAQLSSELAYWEGVQSNIADAIVTPEQVSDIDMKDIDMEPNTAEEVAADILSRKDGHRRLVKIDRESFMRHTGYGAEEMKRFPMMFAKTGGKTMEELGEMVESEMKELGLMSEDAVQYANFGLDAVINLFSQVKTSGELDNYIRDNRVELARQEMEAIMGAYEAAFVEEYGMTPEEYAEYKSRENILHLLDFFSGRAFQYEEESVTFEDLLEYDRYENRRRQTEATGGEIREETRVGESGTLQSVQEEKRGARENDDEGSAGQRQGGDALLLRPQSVQSSGTQEDEISASWSGGGNVQRENEQVSEGASGRDSVTIQGLEDYSEEDILNIVTDHISQFDLPITIRDIKIEGSRTRGEAREDSDLDIVVEYSGEIKEDSVFNVLNDEENRLSIDGIPVDINPIRAEESGTMADHDRMTQEYLNEQEEGPFGKIYRQFVGKAKEAIDFLKSVRSGEAVGALYHKDIGDISLVWGNEKAGLQKISSKHPEALENLQDVLDEMTVVSSSENRIKLESDTHFAVVSRNWLGQEHTPWLLTAYEKKESSANNNSMDTAETREGERNDTATPQDTASSDNKDSDSQEINNASDENSAETPEEVAAREMEQTEQRIIEALERKQQEYADAAQELADTLHTPIVIIDSADQAPTEDTRRRLSIGERIKGFFHDGKIYFVKPYATSVMDARMTILHEVVGHKGVKELLGDAFKPFCREVFVKVMTKAQKREFARYAWDTMSVKEKNDAAPEFANIAGRDLNQQELERIMDSGIVRKIAGDEFIASVAEMDLKPSAWDRLVNMFKGVLHKLFGVKFDLTERDVRIMLQMSRERLENNSTGGESSTGETRLRISTEEQAIIDAAKANGTYLKAPNGADTKLNPEQWARVRTKAFKEWFGDWEKALRINKLRNSEPASIKGDEIEASDDFKQYRKNALEYGKSLRGEYENEDTGNKIIVNKASLVEVLHHEGNNPVHISSIAAIPDMIQRAIYITSEPVGIASERMKNAQKVDYYVCGLKIGGEDYTAKLVVATMANGDLYYDHSLTEIEKGELLNRAELSSTVADNRNAFSDIKDKRLVSILQNNASKVVDENGEPMVVYHGTKDEFYEFAHNEGHKYDSGYLGRGFYFTDIEEVAENYSKWKRGYDENRVLRAFLNMKNPLMTDNYKRAAILTIQDALGLSLTDDVFGANEAVSEGITDELIKQGYDGVIFKTIGDNESIYVATNPNQIKSATENNGEYSSENNDIRFRFIGERGARNADRAEEATTRLDNLAVARDMETAGKDAKSIKMATGWERGADGKWRYEMPDIVLNKAVDDSRKDLMLGDILLGPEGLFTEYPELRDIKVRYATTNQQTLGWYDPQRKEIVLQYALSPHLSPLARIVAKRNIAEMKTWVRVADRCNHILLTEKRNSEAAKNARRREKEIMKLISEATEGHTDSSYILERAIKEVERAQYRSKLDEVVVHEVQHAIQHIEGFAQGSSTDAFENTAEDVMNDIIDATDGHLLDNGAVESNPESIFAALNRKYGEYGDYTVGRFYGSKLDDVAEKYGYENYFDLVQDIESFRSGREQYMKTAGEVEARNVERRMNMTPEERRASLASETEDVARKDQIFIEKSLESSSAVRYRITERKQKQVEIISQSNPVYDDYHTWIRKPEDIKSFDELLSDARRNYEEYGSLMYPDADISVFEAAAETGEIEVFSSYPIEQGVFVTPSRMNAEDYAGSGEVYSKVVKVDDVAWIDDSEGQYASVEEWEEEETRYRRHHSKDAEERSKTNDAIDSALSLVWGKSEAEGRKMRQDIERRHKAMAGEIYEKVLSGDFNSVTLQLIDSYIDNFTPNNPYGRHISQRLPSRVERGLSKVNRANAVDALFSRISERTVEASRIPLAERTRRISQKKNELLEGWAKATGNWYTDVAELTDNTEPIGSGKDSVVYMSNDGKSVIKVSKGKDEGRKFVSDIDAVALYNYVFPDTRYEILGYGNIDGNFVKILQQPRINFSDELVTEQERVDFMRSLGFAPVRSSNTIFSNGELIVADVQKSNIVKDINGQILVIDADVKLHTKDIGGEYTYPDTSAETGNTIAVAEQILSSVQNKVADREEVEGDITGADEIRYRRMKKESPETVLPEDDSSFKGTTISSDAGAKILNNLDKAIDDYENNRNNRTVGFIGTVANALGVQEIGASSKYATFEARNGRVITIRLSNHNAKVSNFDNREEEEGISIVISRKANVGITNDGNAHIVEYFYSDKAINKSEGNPLAEILKSLKQTLYSGEYKDTTGLAEVQEVNEGNIQTDDIRFRIGNKRRNEMSASLAKNRPDLTDEQRDAFFTYMDGLENTKLETATFNWFKNGKINIPEDNYKLDAVAEILRKNPSIDPIRYKTPAELLNEFAPQEGEVNIVPEELFYERDGEKIFYLKKGKTYGDTTVYDMEDSPEAAKHFCENVMQKFYETSPWCLMAWGNHGEWKGRNNWDYYNKTGRKVAFKDGRPVAFYSSDSSKPIWWDETDSPHSGIPVTMDVEGGDMGMKGVFSLDSETGKPDKFPSRVFRGNRKDGRYEEWEVKKRFLSKPKYVKIKEEERRHHKLVSRKIYDADGLVELRNYRDGKLHGESKYWYANGRFEVLEHWEEGAPAGLREVWYRNGDREAVQFFEKGLAQAIVRWDVGGKVDYSTFPVPEGFASMTPEQMTEFFENKVKEDAQSAESSIAEETPVRYRSRFQYGMTAEEIYDAIDAHSEWSDGASNLIEQIESYYGGEIVSASSGARHAMESSGLVPYGDSPYAGDGEEYHHIEFRDSDGETFVRSVPFFTPERIRENSVRYRRVYHGSAADFERFDHSHMGEGEGAQAYGWGTYVTEVEGIGRNYAEIKRNFITYKGKDIREIEPGSVAARVIYKMEQGYPFNEAKDALKGEWRNENFFGFMGQPISEKRSKQLERDLSELNSMSENDFKKANKSRNLYEVEIPDDSHAKYLEWEHEYGNEINEETFHDKALLSARLHKAFNAYKDEAIKNSVESALDAYGFYDDSSITGQYFYEKILVNALGSAKAASEFLSKAGFVGISYPAQYTTGGRSDGARNYVIFKEDDAKIVIHTRFRKVTDKATLDKLESEPTIKVYRAMALIDGKLYPPMSSKVDGKLREPIELGVWEEAEERPDLVDAKGNFKLKKDNNDVVPAKYNPYIHTSRSPLNDQFSSAYKRPNLVTVEVEVPESELTSGYRAEKAKDAVGEMTWHSGPVSGKLPEGKKRRVILSRWDKPVRIVPDSEVAEIVAKMLEGEDIAIPSNTVTPSLRAELEKQGVEVFEADARGRRIEPETRFKTDTGANNARFNEEINRYAEGKMATNEMFHLGRPGGVMSLFLPDLPIVMRQKTVNKGVNKKHNVDLEALVNMPGKLSAPIFVFQRSEDSIGVLTEIKDQDGKNVCVAIELDTTIQDGGDFLEVNDIRSFHGREIGNIISPIVHNGTLKWADKEKALEWFSSASQQVQQEITPQELSSATKIVESFENPTLPEENVEVPTRLRMTRSASVNRAELSSIHDAVDRRGLDGVVGKERMMQFAMDAYKIASEDRRRDILKLANKHGWKISKATEDYLANLVEKPEMTQEETAFFNEVVDAFREMMRESGVEAPVGVADAKMMLWESFHSDNHTDMILKARRAIVQNRNGFLPSQRQMIDDALDGTRFRIAKWARNGSAAQMYNNTVSHWLGQMRETYQDMYRSVELLKEAIEEQTGKKAMVFEDIILAMNRLSSKNLANSKAYRRDFVEPMWDAIYAIMEADKTIDLGDIVEYVMLKHGLERNYGMAKRDAKREYQSEYDAKVREIRANDMLSDAEKQSRIDAAKALRDAHFANVDAEADPKFKANRETDYSGITGHYKEVNDTKRRPKVTTAEKWAAKRVEDFEKKPNGLTDNLWEKINAATKETLRHQFNHGMLSREQYETLKDMYQFYVPLRGFKEETAEDVYSYYSAQKSSGITKAVKEAKGRKSVAESPFGWIPFMADSAIAQDNKNDAKMRLYFFAMNRPEQDLLTIAKAWYVKDNESGEWVAGYPPITEDMDAEERQKTIEDFEEKMRTLQKQGLAHQSKSKLDAGIRIENDQHKKEHMIRLNVLGEEVCLFINGNPRAAQAINGLLNVDAEQSNIFAQITRTMSMLSTGGNPEFWITNFMRDSMFAAISISTKEDAAYTARYAKNFFRAFQVLGLLKRDAKGELGNQGLDALYKEFVDNGGVTGYTVILDQEYYEKDLQKYLKNQKAPVKNAFRAAFETITDIGEAIEQVTRFATYVTSREMGRSIEKSVYDAKEVTVNFNRKGSGKMLTDEEVARLTRRAWMKDKNGKWVRGSRPLNKAERFMVKWLTAPAPYFRKYFMFFNATIQATRTLCHLAYNHPFKAGLWAMAFIMAGTLNALIHAANDDDYLDVSEYERRNNILIGKNGVYFKWALPQEVRPFYALADIFVNHALGRTPNKDITTEVLESFSELLPVNPFKDGLDALMPSFVQPVLEVYKNRDFMGNPIQKELAFMSDAEKEKVPLYQRAYSGTSKILIGIAELLNDTFGGDYATRGDVPVLLKPFENPAAFEHIVQGYGGGLLTTLNKAYKTVSWGVDKLTETEDEPAEPFSFRNTPFLSRIITNNDDRVRNSHTTGLYKYYETIANDAKRRESEYKENKDQPNIDALKASEDYKILEVYNNYKGAFKLMDEFIRDETDRDKKAQYMEEQDALREKMIDDIAAETIELGAFGKWMRRQQGKPEEHKKSEYNIGATPSDIAKMWRKGIRDLDKALELDMEEKDMEEIKKASDDLKRVALDMIKDGIVIHSEEEIKDALADWDEDFSQEEE